MLGVEMKTKILTIAIVAAMILSGIYFYSGHLMMLFFARSNDLDISYKDLKQVSFGDISLSGLDIVERPKGVGLSSQRARIKLAWKGASSTKALVDFNLQEVHFIKRSADKAPVYDTLDNLIAIPFSSQWKYEEISGKIYSSKEGLNIKDFSAKSNDLKFSLSGILYDDSSNIKMEIFVYFSDNLTKRIPPELSGMVLRDESEGWKSFAVKLEGDYMKPSIQVSGKLFRLNIGLKESGGPS